MWEGLIEQRKGIGRNDHKGTGSSPGFDELLYGGVCITQTPYKLNSTAVIERQLNHAVN